MFNPKSQVTGIADAINESPQWVHWVEEGEEEK